MSKLLSLAVAVWAVGPVLVHVTVSPVWIVIVAGENMKSEIVSDGSEAKCATTVRGERPINGDAGVPLRSGAWSRLVWVCGSCAACSAAVRGAVARAP